MGKQIGTSTDLLCGTRPAEFGSRTSQAGQRFAKTIYVEMKTGGALGGGRRSEDAVMVWKPNRRRTI